MLMSTCSKGAVFGIAWGRYPGGYLNSKVFAGNYLLLNSVMMNNLREYIRLIQLVLIRCRMAAWYDSNHLDPPGYWVDI